MVYVKKNLTKHSKQLIINNVFQKKDVHFTISFELLSFEILFELLPMAYPKLTLLLLILNWYPIPRPLAFSMLFKSMFLKIAMSVIEYKYDDVDMKYRYSKFEYE